MNTQDLIALRADVGELSTCDECDEVCEKDEEYPPRYCHECYSDLLKIISGLEAKLKRIYAWAVEEVGEQEQIIIGLKQELAQVVARAERAELAFRMLKATNQIEGRGPQ